MDEHEALGPEDARFLAIDVVARHRHWLVDEPLGLWTGGVNVAIF